MIGWWTDRERLDTIIYNNEILLQGISELKWTGKGEFNSDDHYIYTMGKNALEKVV